MENDNATVSDLLNAWGMHSDIILKFEEENVDTEAMRNLLLDDLRFLIPSVGYRTKFRVCWLAWKEKLHALEDDTSTATPATPASSATSCNEHSVENEQTTRKIAQEVGENIDIIVGGHSHSLLWNGTSPSNETISGPYPVMVESKEKNGHKVLVVTASAFTKYLGNVTTYFDQHGELQSFDGNPVFLDRHIPEDPEIKEMLRPIKEKLSVIVNEVIGYSDDDLIADQCGAQECAIGDFVSDAFLHTVQDLHVSDKPHVTILLRNMIRGSIPGGEINRGAIINILPFTNKLVTVPIKGGRLLEGLHRCMISHWNEHPFNGPWMPQVAGLQVTLNTTDKSVVSVLVKEGENFIPLDEDKEYQLVTLEFLTRGGNGFTMFKSDSPDLKYIGEDAKLVEKYLKKVTPLTPGIDGRVTVLT